MYTVERQLDNIRKGICLMSKRKVLALITQSEATKDTLCNQLYSLLEGYMEIVGYAVETGISSVVKADLIVMSSKMLAEEAKGYAHPGCPIIIANRSLNIENVDKLFHIPNGTEVLLVNDEMENSIEVIKLLREIGIDYLHFIPYAPGSVGAGNAKIAITPGEVALVPKSVESIIDIGARVIDLTTIIEILSVLGLLDEKARLISAKYMETIIRLNKELHDSMEEASSMNNYLVKVLNQVNDGIIAFSKDGTISVFNEKSEEVFGVKSLYAIGRNIRQISRDKNVSDFLLASSDLADRLFRINDTDVIINKFKIAKLNSIVCTIKNTKETIEMEKKLRQGLIKKGFVGKYRFSDIIGSSAVMRNIVETARKLAKADLSILIYGESGVGKELFASAVHNESGRNMGPFLAVNFSELSEELVESELFGYEEGAFTGARKGGKLGLFEQANGGTIFLDEIGDISPRIQARLLRVLQEKEIRRVGGTEIIPVNVRVIAATNKNLANMCQTGEFREDLYHRLKRLYLKIPPLRDHLEDLDELIRHFIVKKGRAELVISEPVMTILRSNAWTGNVRELENTIDYFLAVCEDPLVDTSHMPPEFYEIQPSMKRDENHYDAVLCTRGNIDEFNFILRTIYEYNRKGRIFSRKTVSELAKDKFPYMTEDRVRRRSDILQGMGLISKGAGRCGMRLTLEGIKYVENKTIGQIG
jgi:sigma-54 dependent transcriptional regulator, acetoin dehydrogenase operon transcriptional activator AcoR